MPLLKPIRAIQLDRNHPLARGLTGCWLMNEGVGEKVADYGPNRLHGNIQYSTSPPAWQAGRHGSCLEFASERLVNCGTSKFGWDLTNEVSVVSLVNQSANQTNSIFNRSAYCYPINLHAQANGKICWRVNAGSLSITTSTSIHAIDGSEWVHAAATFRRYDSRLYVNGVQEAIDTSIGGSLTFGNYIAGIGGGYTGSAYICCFIGRIEYVFIYNRALSAEEIRRLSREPYAMFESRTGVASLYIPETIVPLSGTVNAASTASAKLESICSLPAVELDWLSDALFNGTTSNAFKLGTALSLGWFWMRPKGCSTLYRGVNMDKIDFANILTTAEQNTTAISPPSYLEHEPDSTYFYILRRFNNCGRLERTLAAAKVSLDEYGWLAASRPNNIFSSTAEQTAPDKVTLTWFYCPLEQASQPLRFGIYHDSGTGQVDYENPLATVAYRNPGFYSWQSDSLKEGTHLFAIRAEDDGAIASYPSTQLSIQLRTTNPEPIEIISSKSI